MNIMRSSVTAAAQALLEARNNRSPYVSVSETHGISDLSGAYDVQEAFVDLLLSHNNSGIAGYKIALTSKVMQEMCGVDRPLAGAILNNVIFTSPARIALADFQHLGLEFETAVVLATDMPDRGHPYTLADVPGCVDACAPAFELIEDGNADYAKLDAVGITADNAWNGGIVMGEPCTAWKDINLRAAGTQLEWGEEGVQTATTGEAMGHPFEAVAWVANHLIERGHCLKAGHVVMTGSTMKTRFPGGGEDIRYSIDGLGAVSLKIE